MFTKILIANRGEIAIRIARTARRMGIQTVAVWSDADKKAPFVTYCDESVRIGPAPASESYLNIPAIVAAVQATGAEAVHPGYGFLSENAEFADALDGAGIVFIGPRTETIRAMGSKAAARDLMQAVGVPVTPGYQGEDQSPATFAREANRTGYPVLLKAVAGGGGKGMRLVETPDKLAEALQSAQREAKSAFGDDRFLIEKHIARARHLEVQIFGDGNGNIVHMFERDCSVQRRHQKVLEEAPAPRLPTGIRQTLLQAGIDAGKAVNYRGAGTVEFLHDGESAVYFMEMNTRLQVEHPVSEMITGLDFVEWQIRIAAGEGLPLAQDKITANGHAVEARLYAEKPQNDFAPSVGQLTCLQLPDTIARVDSGVRQGQDITSHYDPMLAKIITHGTSRPQALGKLRAALKQTHVAGLETNTGFLHALADHPAFGAGHVSTRFIDEHQTRLLANNRPGPAAWAVAALWKCQEARQAVCKSPCHNLQGFRLNGESCSSVWIMHAGHPALITLTKKTDGYNAILQPDAGIAARHARRTPQEPVLFDFSVIMHGGGHFRLHMVERDTHVFAAPHRDGLRIWVDGQCVDIAFPAPFDRAPEDKVNDDSLTAPMSGIITQLAARVGDKLKAGETIMVMEAMKMEHIIRAPFDGTVTVFKCQQGDQVREGDLLVDFEKC